MSFLFLIALFVGLGVPPQPITEPVVGLRLLGVLLGMLVVVSFAHAIGASTRVRLRDATASRAKTLSRYYRLRMVHDFLALGIYAAILHGAGWASLVRIHWKLQGWILVDELLLLAPYLICEVLSLISFYLVDKRARETRHGELLSKSPQWTLGKYINFQFRHHVGVFLVGSLTISSARDLIDWIYPGWESQTWSAVTFGLGLSVGMLICSPYLLRFVWGTSPLKPGTLRSELELIAKRIGFRYSNILIWNTGGVVVNAAVTGIVPQVRYVLLSDALVEQLAPEEIAAVFGHEIGHVKHHHLSYYLFFIFLSILFAGLLGQWIQIQLAPWVSGTSHPWIDWLARNTPYDAILLVPYVFFVFGMLSRRCERQADVFGSRAVSMIVPEQPTPEQSLQATTDTPAEPFEEATALVPTVNASSANIAVVESSRNRKPQVTSSGARVFVQSLEKVASLNGMSRSAPNWRHGSIEQRIAFLENIVQDPKLADRYDSNVRRFRIVLALGLMMGIVSLAWATNEFGLRSATTGMKTAVETKANPTEQP